MSAATAAAQTVETQNLLLERKRHFSFQSDRLEVRKMYPELSTFQNNEYDQF